MGYYEGYDVFGAAAAALVVIEHLQNNQIKTNCSKAGRTFHQDLYRTCSQRRSVHIK